MSGAEEQAEIQPNVRAALVELPQESVPCGAQDLAPVLVSRQKLPSPDLRVQPSPGVSLLSGTKIQLVPSPWVGGCA